MNQPWDREFISKQPFVKQTWCCDRSDEAALLSEIVGWSVDCENEKRYDKEVSYFKTNNFITIRRHKAPAGEWDAYALTDAGFERLKETGYGDLYDTAIKRHRWYAKHGSL